MPCRCATSCATGPDIATGFPGQPLNLTTSDRMPRTSAVVGEPPRSGRNAASSARFPASRRGGHPLGQVDRNDRAVLPEALQAVVDALLLVEDVDDQVAEVEQHPPRLLAALAAQPLVPGFKEFVLDLVCDR